MDDSGSVSRHPGAFRRGAAALTWCLVSYGILLAIDWYRVRAAFRDCPTARCEMEPYASADLTFMMLVVVGGLVVAAVLTLFVVRDEARGTQFLLALCLWGGAIGLGVPFQFLVVAAADDPALRETPPGAFLVGLAVVGAVLVMVWLVVAARARAGPRIPERPRSSA